MEKLQTYGLSVDPYGACGMSLTADPKEMISNDYRFYLGFENSVRSYYVTEKVLCFRHYSACLGWDRL